METGKKYIARKLYGRIEVMNELGHCTLKNISVNDRPMPRMEAMHLLRGQFDGEVFGAFHPEWVKIQIV